MNRRNFLATLTQAAAAFTILPSAVTYERTWKMEGELWVDSGYSCIVETALVPNYHEICLYQLGYNLTGKEEWRYVEKQPSPEERNKGRWLISFGYGREALIP